MFLIKFVSFYTAACNAAMAPLCFSCSSTACRSASIVFDRSITIFASFFRFSITAFEHVATVDIRVMIVCHLSSEIVNDTGGKHRLVIRSYTVVDRPPTTQPNLHFIILHDGNNDKNIIIIIINRMMYFHRVGRHISRCDRDDYGHVTVTVVTRTLPVGTRYIPI